MWEMDSLGQSIGAFLSAVPHKDRFVTITPDGQMIIEGHGNDLVLYKVRVKDGQVGVHKDRAEPDLNPVDYYQDHQLYANAMKESARLQPMLLNLVNLHHSTDHLSGVFRFRMLNRVLLINVDPSRHDAGLRGIDERCYDFKLTPDGHLRLECNFLPRRYCRLYAAWQAILSERGEKIRNPVNRFRQYNHPPV